MRKVEAMSIALALAWAASGCGRIGYEAAAEGEDAGPGTADGEVATGDAGRGAENGDAAPAPTEECEDVCVDGHCEGDRCVIDCTGGDCIDEVECPPGIPCEVDCSAVGACSGGVDCGSASTCEVKCSAKDSCIGGVDCRGGGACQVECSGRDSCVGGIVCGGGACEVECSSQGACVGGVECGDACRCGVSCTAQETCLGGTECLEGCSGDDLSCLSTDSCDRC